MARHLEAGEDVEGAEMLLSEERLRVEARTVPTGRVRLQRVVVTERRTIEVEVRHEEIRVVQDDGPEYGELAAGTGRARETPWVPLREERIEVVRRLEPVERVRLVLDRVTGEVPVEAQVRREVLDLDTGGVLREG